MSTAVGSVIVLPRTGHRLPRPARAGCAATEDEAAEAIFMFRVV
ncbi:hypothetical protein OTB20_04270 [Streptomyces sp. H27-H1]|nr:hypothetical protein [Streptomyces sp. H27-H1]MCY0925430.1 hypothetical protein [Streptomyces sp. H27-H1]